MIGLALSPAVARADKANDLENACYNSKRDVAVSVCTAAIEAANEHTALNLVYAQRGDAYTDLGQYPQAIADHDQAIKLNPTFDAFYRDRGAAYVLMGQYPRSIEDFSEAIRLDPNSADAYCCRGLARKNGDEAGGDADIATARKIDPSIDVD